MYVNVYYQVQLIGGDISYDKFYKESQIYGPGFLTNLPQLVKLNKGIKTVGSF